MPATEVASTAILGITTLMEVETVAGGGVYQELGMVESLDKPEATYDELEATHMGSPDQAKEFKSGLVDYGDQTVELFWKPGDTTDDFIEDWREGGNENRSCRFTTPNGKVYTYPAFVKSYSGTIAVGELMKATLVLRVAGAVVRS